ncbi:hypothetical protein FYJ24_07355 [Actinomycetaceae bacterium WB03_NA08]|uniref:T6SS immunity protein Tdi1 C-terminal domain-containing protein n=1 Tax=Scrofimicrobium canadense TaxID=2652290 RepID=A0A6N7W589_9ACTO|nr:DUF1851 domain-containing protein [Scrofimicrobium canadense]MSS84581.1 hypothetical protein [Scrofimicrobium canadense]
MSVVVDQLTGGKGGRYVVEHMRPVFADNGYCGVSLNQGMLRFHDAETGPLYRALVGEAFPDFAARGVDVLAFDWQGRQYATVDSGGGESDIWVADIGRGSIDAVCSVENFIAALKDDHAFDTVFERELLDQWRGMVGAENSVIPFDSCVAYEVPIFLGGSEGVDNLEVADLEVNWTVGAQIYAQVKDLPEGASVNFTFE